jgi:ABC-type nickel/cobalt efflux system permease component RcnA
VSVGCLRGLMVKAPPSQLSDTCPLGDLRIQGEMRVRHPSRVFNYVCGAVAGVLHSWRMCVRAWVRTHTNTDPHTHTHTHTHRQTHTHTHTDTQRCALRNTRPRQERQRRTQHGHNPPSLFQPKTATLKDIAIAPMTTTLARCLAELLR